MKLHLPKALFTAVIAAFAVSPAAYALTVENTGAIASYDSFLTDGTATTLPDGVTYDASTGVLTGMDSKNLYFILNTTALTADNANQHVIYITNDSAVSWGINTTSDGTSLTGYWSPHVDEETNPGGNWTSSSTADLTLLNTDTSGQAIMKASMGSGVGTYLYNDESVAVFSESGLKTGGTITAFTVNNTFVSSILYNVQYENYTVSNTDGTFSRTYENEKVSFNVVPTSQMDATIVNDAVLEINGASNSSNLDNIANAGDIIVGGSGCLWLQTWKENADNNTLENDIVIDNDIYIGQTTQGMGALSTADYSGDIIINGDVTLIEDACFTKEEQPDSGERGTNTIINGKLSGEYTLSVKGKNTGKDFDDIEFAGEIDLKGLTFASNAGSVWDWGLNQWVTSLSGSIDVTISGKTAIDKLTVDSDAIINKSGTRSMTFGAEGASATTDAIVLKQKLELAGSGTINVNGAIRGDSSENAELVVGESIILNADTFHAGWSMPTIRVDGEMSVDTFNLSTDAKASYVSGGGIIKAGSFNMGNKGSYHISGVRIEVGADGVNTTDNGAYHTVYTGDVTFVATTDSWTWDTGKDLALADETTGTTFEVAKEKTITIDNRLVDKVVSVTTGEGDEATTTQVTTAGKLIKTGEGTLLLNTNNTYTGATHVQAGTLEITGGKTMGSTAITVDANAALVLNSGSYSNAISGEGQLVKKSDGDVTLATGDSAFSGDVIVESGWIKTSKDNALGTGSITIKGGAGVELTQASDGAGNLTTNSAINLEGGTLRVQNGYYGDTVTSDIKVKDGGVIQAGWGGNSGVIASAISGTGELTLNQCIWGGNPTGDAWKLTGVISDQSASEKLSIQSDANVTLSGANTYSGGTTITSNTLKTAGEGALGSGKVTVEGGTLEQTAALVVSELEYKSGAVSNAGNALEVGKLTVASGVTLTNTTTDTGTITVTDTLTVGGENALVLNGALVLGNNVAVDLTGLNIEDNKTSYTLATAANGVTLQNYTLTGLDLTGTMYEGYEMTISAMDPNAAAGIATLADGANTNTALVLTLTAPDTPVTPTTLTEVNVSETGSSYADGVLTLQTEETLADFAGLGDKLNVVIGDALWEKLVADYKIGTLVDVALKDAAGVYFDLNGADDTATGDDVLVTLNGIATDKAPVYGEAGGVNGAVVGSYVTAYIPEPTSTTLSLLALAALAVRRRRR